ncbi:MAG: hypothetical protein ACI4A5_05520 [Hominilimicola sp.]
MKLDLDFSLYKGTIQLKNWWKAVKEHFTQVQEAHNALDTALENEIASREKTDDNLAEEATNRTNADTVLQKKITEEASARANADTVLDGRITEEASARENADNILQQNIDAEKTDRNNAYGELQQKIIAESSARTNADRALDVRVTAVEEKAHTHANKTVIDGITAADIAAWDGIKEQVSKTQLDEAIKAEKTERTEADNSITAGLDAVQTYFAELCYDFLDEFQRVYGAIGVTVYDGGIFGMEQNNIALDGGYFDDEITATVDCGAFMTESEAVVDGGKY